MFTKSAANYYHKSGGTQRPLRPTAWKWREVPRLGPGGIEGLERAQNVLWQNLLSEMFPQQPASADGKEAAPGPREGAESSAR